MALYSVEKLPPLLRVSLLQSGYASFAETLTGKQADFDLRLIQPASTSGGVVACEASPDPVSRRLAVVVGQ